MLKIESVSSNKFGARSFSMASAVGDTASPPVVVARPPDDNNVLAERMDRLAAQNALLGSVLTAIVAHFFADNLIMQFVDAPALSKYTARVHASPEPHTVAELARRMEHRPLPYKLQHPGMFNVLAAGIAFLLARIYDYGNKSLLDGALSIFTFHNPLHGGKHGR